ncbi:DUF4097 family beta strand repeat-containing protein [Actinophytocola glycyrrhizae]|uniref:DUF4097 family beta strand repeat-containing protein n=1 Tax=Actinophytocola glycyrrhizae TaxID=2044873 RepID=A0ABV9S249_9PSEU
MRIRHVVAGITVVAGGLLLTGCVRFGHDVVNDQATIGEAITEVRFANDSGDVRITVGDTTEVRRTVRYDGEQPGVTHRVDGSALIVDACPIGDCSIDYELTVPAGARISGHVDSGDIELTGVASANVESESGGITVRDVDGEVNASVQSGNVELTGIGGAVVATAESGDVQVGLVAKQGVSVETQSGNIDVSVPAGKYDVTASTESGNLDNSVGDDPSGLPIEARAQSGNVTISAT